MIIQLTFSPCGAILLLLAGAAPLGATLIIDAPLSWRVPAGVCVALGWVNYWRMHIVRSHACAVVELSVRDNQLDVKLRSGAAFRTAVTCVACRLRCLLVLGLAPDCTEPTSARMPRTKHFWLIVPKDSVAAGAMSLLHRWLIVKSFAEQRRGDKRSAIFRRSAVAVLVFLSVGIRLMSVYAVDRLVSEARRLAAEFKRATGRPLAVSGEIARHDAIRLLDLSPAPEGTAGFDALGQGADAGLRYLIKGRAVFDQSKGGRRLGQIKLDQPWDRIALVLMNDDFETVEVYVADRSDIEAVWSEATSSKRSSRGALSVARFKAISTLAWSEPALDIDPE